MIIKHEFDITQRERIERNKFPPFFILFTGLSGAGKTTIANKLEQKLFDLDILSYVLDGDNLRNGINKDLYFSERDRKENLRRMAEIAKLFMDAGILVIGAFIAPYIESRNQIKSIVGADNYVEVFVNTSLETCKKRDVKGLYAKAERGEIINMTGVDAPYETPKNPTIEITEKETLDEAVEIIFKAIYHQLKI
ncbi:adenylyl-sulfate kinase [Aquimarina sp. 2201CG14-23]|uniref:adenylyl-sulfate kinase n=1 Tax=Aquimarina mycalae TaxID=3040073 RepID=UPI0032AF4903